MKYRVLVDDNWHYMDESERRSAGEYDSLEDAITTAKRIVDRSLIEFASHGRTSDELYQHYCMYGDDPFIVGSGKVEFSAREYAAERSSEFDGEPWHLLVAVGRYAEAEPLMLAGTPQTPDVDPYGDNTVARAEFYEKWGDAAGTGPEAIKHYRESQNYFGLFASWSTSGGEGTARMTDVNRVRNKLEALDIDR